MRLQRLDAARKALTRALSRRTALALGLSLAVTAALSLFLGISSTGLPYLSASPSTDPTFGALNSCVSRLLGGRPLGWAVAMDASRVVAFTGRQVVLCGPGSAQKQWPWQGVSQATFDKAGGLWLAMEGGLFHVNTHRPEERVLLGAFVPIALAGHAQGVLALDAAGHLVSLDGEGTVLASQELPRRPRRAAQLSSGPDARRTALVVDGALWVFEAERLTPLRFFSDCPVEHMWWEGEEQVTVACKAGPAEALRLHLTPDARPVPVARPKGLSWRLAQKSLLVEDCEGLPCGAAPHSP